MSTKLLIHNVKEGMKLSKPIYQCGVCLLEAGKKITSRQLEILKKRRVLRISVF
ncbi:MAG: hypothetical protein WC002_03780 [Candidatus Muiribacteriota bacterium]